VLRAALRTVREPRYAMLSALMLVVALVCVGAGTWQITRFEQKVHANDALRADAAAAVTPVARVLPIARPGKPMPAVDADNVRYRRVAASGAYQVADQVLVRGRSVGGQQGFLVLTPLSARQAMLLVARGFVAAAGSGAPPAVIAAPPAGTVRVVGRVQTGESGPKANSGMPAGQVRTIDPAGQADRLERPVYAGYVELEPGQPGAAHLTALPGPDLSNPAGGAVEPQHFAYIIQWYLFAILALAAPFAMARAETKHRREEEYDAAPGAAPAVVPELSAAERRAAKLADRYGRPVR
jgi:cytochrome oxidase assembly protein ShyY1